MTETGKKPIPKEPILIGPWGDPGGFTLEKGPGHLEEAKERLDSAEWIDRAGLGLWIFGTDDPERAKAIYVETARRSPYLAVKAKHLATTPLEDLILEDLEIEQRKIRGYIANDEGRIPNDLAKETERLYEGLDQRGVKVSEGYEDNINKMKGILSERAQEKKPQDFQERLSQALERQTRVLEDQAYSARGMHAEQVAQMKELADVAKKVGEEQKKAIRETLGGAASGDIARVRQQMREEEEKARQAVDPQEKAAHEAAANALRAEVEDLLQSQAGLSSVFGGGRYGEIYMGFGRFKEDPNWTEEQLKEERWKYFNGYLEKLEDQGGRFDYTLMYPLYGFLGDLAEKEYEEYKFYNDVLSARRFLQEVAGLYDSGFNVEPFVQAAYLMEMKEFNILFRLRSHRDSGSFAVAEAFRQYEKRAKRALVDMEDEKTFLETLNTEFSKNEGGDRNPDGTERTPEDLVKSPAFSKGDRLRKVEKEISDAIEVTWARRVAERLWKITGRKDFFNRRPWYEWDDNDKRWFRKMDEAERSAYKLDGGNDPGNHFRKVIWPEDWLRQTGGGIGIPEIWQFIDLRMADFFSKKGENLKLVDSSRDADKTRQLSGTKLDKVPGMTGMVVVSLEETRLEQIDFSDAGEHAYGSLVKDMGDAESTRLNILKSGFHKYPNEELLTIVLNQGGFTYLAKKTQLELTEKLLDGVLRIHTNTGVSKERGITYWRNEKIRTAILDLYYRGHIDDQIRRRLENRYLGVSREFLPGPIRLPTFGDFRARAAATVKDLVSAFLEGTLGFITGALFGGKR